MAISLNAKVDFLFKKLGFGVSRTDSESIKGATNESIASPLLNRGDKAWVQASLIPATLPTNSSATVKVYKSTELIEASADVTASANRTWLTGITDWIPPEFGSTYQVKVYLHDETDSDSAAVLSNQLFAAGSGNDDEWFFDYQAGVLHFMGENLPNGKSFTDKSIYISGGQYTGIVGLQGAGFDSDQVISIIEENAQRIVEVNLDSDLRVVADLRNEVNILQSDRDSDHTSTQLLFASMRSRLDSDTLVIQTLKTKQDKQLAKLDSDHALFQEKILAIEGVTDSDLSVVANLRNNVDSLRLDVDSDTTFIQTLKTKQSELKNAIDSDYALFQTKLSNVRGFEDSDLTVVAALRNDVDTLKLDRDSDYALFQTKLSNVRGFEDSDLTVVAALRNDVDTLKLDRDSDYALFQTKLNAITGIGDSDLTVVANLRNDITNLKSDIDSETSRMQTVSSYVDRIKLDIDSDFTHFSQKVSASGGVGDSDITVLNVKVNTLKSDRDSDSVVASNHQSQITLLLAKVAILESYIGIGNVTPAATPVPTDSDSLANVSFVTDSDSILENAMNITWRVLSGDGSTVASANIVLAKGMEDADVLRVLAYNIETHPIGKDFWNTIAYRADTNKIEYAFLEKFSIAEYTLTITINSHGGDNPRFTIALPTA
tara:strand:+ start:16330 stop:18306 length:1977 start_codon:yes stop_codon:yes gene_type:complete